MIITYNLLGQDHLNCESIFHDINLLFLLFYRLNNMFFDTNKSEQINTNKLKLCFTLKNINGVKMDNYLLDVLIEKIIHDDNNIQYTINNINLECDNIQFTYFTIYIQKLDYEDERKTEHYKIVINYDIDKDLYPRFMIEIFNKMIKKMFSNLYEYLICKINNIE